MESFDYGLGGVGIDAFLACAEGKDLRFQLQTYDGKSYKSFEDPEYLSYDLVLRTYLAKKMKGRFGIDLDPKTYSGFDLLEIEAFFKCKKIRSPSVSS